MSMICYALRVAPDVCARIAGDDDLADGLIARATKAYSEQQFEDALARLPEPEREAARQRRKDSRANLSPQFQALFAEQEARERRAADIALANVLCLENEWDALHRVFERAGSTLFVGEPTGLNNGYGQGWLRSSQATAEFSIFLGHGGAKTVETASMTEMRTWRLYAWPEPGEPEPSDDELKRGLTLHFAALRDYVEAAANAGDGLLVWIS